MGVKLLGEGERQVDAAVASAVLVDGAAEAAAPGGVVQSDSAVEGHPVVDEGCVQPLGSPKDAVPLLVIDLEHSLVRGAGRDRRSGHAVGLHDLAGVLEENDVLILDAYIHVVQAVAKLEFRVRLEDRHLNHVVRKLHVLQEELQWSIYYS